MEFIGLFWIIFIVVMCVMWWCAAIKMQEIAESKGADYNYFWWCFLVPFVGYAMVIALPDRGGKKTVNSAAGAGSTAGSSENAKHTDHLPEF